MQDTTTMQPGSIPRRGRRGWTTVLVGLLLLVAVSVAVGWLAWKNGLLTLGANGVNFGPSPQRLPRRQRRCRSSAPVKGPRTMPPWPEQPPSSPRWNSGWPNSTSKPLPHRGRRRMRKRCWRPSLPAAPSNAASNGYLNPVAHPLRR
jgi:hypothetical protein